MLLEDFDPGHSWFCHVHLTAILQCVVYRPHQWTDEARELDAECYIKQPLVAQVKRKFKLKVSRVGAASSHINRFNPNVHEMVSVLRQRSTKTSRLDQRFIVLNVIGRLQETSKINNNEQNNDFGAHMIMISGLALKWIVPLSSWQNASHTKSSHLPKIY